MPTALYRLILSCLLLLPWAAHADDASDFAAANNSEQAQLLENWAAHPSPARVELINSLQQGLLTVDGAPQKLRLNNRLRGLIDTAVASHQLLAADPKLRLVAAQQLQKSAKPAQPGAGQSATGRPRPGSPPGRCTPARRNRRTPSAYPP